MSLIGRRHALLATGAAVLAGPARATPVEVAAEIAKVTRGTVLKPGQVKLDLAQMVENGNAVGVTVSAEPPAGTRVASLHLFAEQNPNPEVFHATIGPAGLPRLATRIRLATSQQVIAVAVMEDGTCWSDAVTVMVTLAACLE
ncbi:MAG: thiosulfate oxidation carrier protein SoxY [Janthinobacterium lividum]